MELYTIGHSTHSLEDFIAILRAYRIEYLVDVRSIPRSLHTPQFNEETLSDDLIKVGICYTHLGSLGGLRHTTKDSKNIGWHNKSFRGYADYMQTADFSNGIDELIAIAGQHRTAIMCAEVLPWRCHRSLIGDAMLVRGWRVLDIYNEHTVKDESITQFANVDGMVITYPDDIARR